MAAAAALASWLTTRNWTLIVQAQDSLLQRQKDLNVEKDLMASFGVRYSEQTEEIRVLRERMNMQLKTLDQLDTNVGKLVSILKMGGVIRVNPTAPEAVTPGSSETAPGWGNRGGIRPAAPPAQPT